MKKLLLLPLLLLCACHSTRPSPPPSLGNLDAAMASLIAPVQFDPTNHLFVVGMDVEGSHYAAYYSAFALEYVLNTNGGVATVQTVSGLVPTGIVLVPDDRYTNVIIIGNVFTNEP